MVNGPPTPPPTTTTELQDQLRSQSQPQPEVPHSDLPAPQDSFPATFSFIVDLAGKGLYRELLLKAEETDVLMRRCFNLLNNRIISHLVQHESFFFPSLHCQPLGTHISNLGQHVSISRPDDP